jgi:hypothetical protein
MNLRTLRGLGTAVTASALFVVACSGNAATTGPSTPAGAGQSAAPTLALPSLAIPSIAIPSIAIPSIAIPSIAIPTLAIPSIAIPSIALPSGSFDLPSFSFPSEDKDLEARLPNQINGVTLTKYSLKGSTFLESGTSNSQDLIDLLSGLGKSPNDMSVAFASDTSGTIDVQIGAFQIRGADSNALLNGFLAATKKETPEDVIATANVGGKNVTTIVDPTDTESGTVYVYVSGDVLFYVLSPDAAVAGSVLQALP